jgi:hypothetical protein
VTEFDPIIDAQLQKLVQPTASTPDWQDVIARWRPPVWRRPLVLACAATLIALATGAGVMAALGGFDTWLSGKPGKPAAAADQQRFRAANGRSWASFPTGTQLRQLIDATVGGRRYVLFGFRSGNALCLKLRAVTLGSTSAPACTPASTLAHLESPLLVVNGGTGLSDQHAHETAELSYGIVADGVTRVDVHAVDGTHRALLGGNAYLWVENDPNTGNFVTRITAAGPGSRVTSLPIAPFSITGALRSTTSVPAPGPTRLQAHIAHPTIGWYARREPRGLSMDQARLTREQRSELRRSDKGFLRLVKPDPLSNVVVGLTGHLCLLIVSGGEGCSPTRSFFSQGPLNVEEFSPDGQAYIVVGAAADGVNRVTVFTSDGQRQRAPIRDNLFTALVAARQGARVVGYDAAGRVVAIQTFTGFGLGQPPPAALRHLRVAVTAAGPNGAIGTIRVGPVIRYLRCWRAEFSTGQRQTGCVIQEPTGPWTSVEGVQPAGRDVFVIGSVRVPVVRVRLRFADGSAIGAKQVDGMFLFAVPRAHLSRSRQLAFVIGYDALGHRVQRQGVLFRASG